MTGISLPHIIEMAISTTRHIYVRCSDSLSTFIHHFRPDASQLKARIRHLEQSRQDERARHQQELASSRAEYEVQKRAASRLAAELLALKSNLARTSGSSFTDPVTGLLTMRGAAEELIVAVSTLWHASWVPSSHDQTKQLPCSVVLFDLSWVTEGHAVPIGAYATILREAFSRRSDIIFRPSETADTLCIIISVSPP